MAAPATVADLDGLRASITRQAGVVKAAKADGKPTVRAAARGGRTGWVARFGRARVRQPRPLTPRSRRRRCKPRWPSCRLSARSWTSCQPLWATPAGV